MWTNKETIDKRKKEAQYRKRPADAPETCKVDRKAIQLTLEDLGLC